MEPRAKLELTQGVVGALVFLCSVIFVLMLVYQASDVAKIATGALLGALIAAYLVMATISGCRWRTRCPPWGGDIGPMTRRRRMTQPYDITLTQFREPAAAARPAAASHASAPHTGRRHHRSSAIAAELERVPPPDYKAVLAAGSAPPPSYSEVAAAEAAKAAAVAAAEACDAGYCQSVNLDDERPPQGVATAPSAPPTEP